MDIFSTVMDIDPEEDDVTNATVQSIYTINLFTHLI